MKLRFQIFSGILNQAISSIINFSYGVYLLRTLEMADFGIYNMAFAAILFVSGASQGFFLVQMTVITPTMTVSTQRNFLARVQILLICAMGFLCVIAASASYFLSTTTYFSTGVVLIWPIVITSIAFMAKEFHIRLAFNDNRGLDAVAIHLVLACILLAAVIFTQTQEIVMSVSNALMLYALANIIAAMLGQLRSGLRMRGHNFNDLIETLRLVQSGGKWAFLTNIIFSLRSQAHTIIVGAALGPVGVAKINAARILVTPAVLVIPALSQVMLPRLSILREVGGIQNLRHLQRKITLGLMTVAISYAAFLLMVYPKLSNFVFGGRYDGLFWITALWCGFAIAQSVRSGFDITIQALRRFKLISAINVIGAFVALATVYVLTNIMGISGAVIGVACGELVVMAGFWLVLVRESANFVKEH